MCLCTNGRAMTVDPPSTERDTISKATLFCPDCDHRSRYDGDWIVVETAAGRSYRCPDCRAEITVRRSYECRGGRRTLPRAARHTLTAWQAGVAAWERLWRRTVLRG